MHINSAYCRTHLSLLFSDRVRVGVRKKKLRVSGRQGLLFLGYFLLARAELLAE
jgi:hypothetical protein